MGSATMDAIERIFWTAVQAFLGTLIASNVFDSLGLDWVNALEIAGMAALAAVAKSILAIAATKNGTPQLGVTTYNSEG